MLLGVCEPNALQKGKIGTGKSIDAHGVASPTYTEKNKSSQEDGMRGPESEVVV